MTRRSLKHSTFTLEREYKVPPERVFQAFADPELKRRWFDGPSDEWDPIDSSTDFREGGREHNASRHVEGGFVSRFELVYHEIVDGQRMVYSYEIRMDDVRISVSLTSIELAATEAGTLLTMTEQGVYFDEHEDPADREEGTRQILEAIAPVVEG